MTKPFVAIVGRPNVGKSTLFNRLIGERRAVVSDIPGTTRDRIIAESEWNGRSFLVVDTGGIEILPPTVESGRRPGPDQHLLEDSVPFIPMIRAQAEVAIEEADLILFLTDAKAGLTNADREVANLLRRTEKPVLLVANKVESETAEHQAYEFYELGLGEMMMISAIHGGGVGDLLDRIVESLPSQEEIEPAEDDAVHIAILGRPNVGKSSLLNRLIGEERAIVSPVAGTTRDAVDTRLIWEGQEIVLIDTAGIRRRGRVSAGVEKWSVLRTARALRRAEVALLMIDATEGVTAQDTHIAGMIDDEGVSVVVIVNKWDAVTAEQRKHRNDLEFQVRDQLKFLSHIPVLFISALTGDRVQHVLPTAREVVAARYQRIPTGSLNDLVQEALMLHAPPSRGGRNLRVFYALQTQVGPPRFVFYVNDPKLVHFSYRRYMENRIRDFYSFPGTPLKLVFKSRDKIRENRELSLDQSETPGPSS
jgi:GTP-binding protein